jgi:hypothetical protein
MRASDRLMCLAIALWLLGVLLSAGKAYSPELNFRLSGAQYWVGNLNQKPNACRIFLVGSSLVAVGLSAQQLERETGCAAVNAGQIDIADQINRHLEVVLDRIRPGDIVVLADKVWTDFGLDGKARAERSDLDYMLRAWSVAPNLLVHVKAALGIGTHRDKVGDYTFYPSHVSKVDPLQVRPLVRLSERVQVAAEQIRLIKRRGARPVLAGVPMLVRDGDQAAARAQFARLAASIAVVPDLALWIAPMVLTDAGLFTIGQHLSAEGRQVWTANVLHALRGAQLVP